MWNRGGYTPEAGPELPNPPEGGTGESGRRIEFTKAELAVIDFHPGDTAVLMFPGPVSPERMQWVSDVWRQVRPDIKCVVLADGARLGVIRAVD